MSLKELSEKLYPAFIRTFDENLSKPCRLFLSATNMKERALIRHAVSDTPEEAWMAALSELEKILTDEPAILRADWVTASETVTWAECLERIKAKRRNYFRQGIAFDKNYNLAFMEQELNANAICCNLEQEDKRGEFQTDKAAAYCQQRFGQDFPKLADTDEVELFNTTGIFIQAGMTEPLTITAEGRRVVDADNGEMFFDMARRGTNYLVTQCGADGRFIYGLYPCDDSVVPGYNTHRHFGTLFAMAETYEICADDEIKKSLGAAIENGLEYGIRNLLRYKKTDDGTEMAYFSEGRATTIGISGLALLAFTKWTTSTGTTKYISLMNALARGIIATQKPDGTFTQVLNIRNFSVRKEFSVTFYDGEALYGMLRLYAITKDEYLLESVERAINGFAEKKYWEHHDHWMQYTLNELTLFKPTAKYFKFGLDNISSYLPNIRRSTVHNPTQLEMIMAAENMIRRMKSLPDMKDLLKDLDDKYFYSTTDIRAERMCNSYFWPEVAMYFKNPERMVGSFYVRTDAFRVRIDDVQHTISGLLAYYKCFKGASVELQPIKLDKPVAVEKVDAVKSNRTVIKAGSVRVTIETDQAEPVEVEGVKVKSVAVEENPPISVGIMKRVKANFWEMSNARYPMFCMAKHFNIELLFFAPQDIDFETMTVNAITLENNAVVHKTAPIPKIIDNDITYSRPATAPIMRKLREHSYLIRPIAGMRKQTFYTTLAKDGRFNDYLIKTTTVKDFQHFQTLFEKNNFDVIMKPGNGVGGSGVVHLIYDDNKCFVTFKTVTTELKTVEELEKFYNEHFTDRPYIMQPYVTSRTRQGNPFDVRIHARRGAGGKFVTFLYPRIGNGEGVISNIVAGGYTMGLEPFLKTEYGDDWKVVYDKLMFLSDNFPDYYQSFFKDTIFDIGIDVGIQKRNGDYELKLFEAYIQPGFTMIRNEVAVTNFDYYRYLDQKIREGSLK